MFVAIGLLRLPLQAVLLVAIPVSIAVTISACGGGQQHEFSDNPIWALISTFGLMSLFAVGGANSAIPEMHRIAVDVHHWMTDKQFADAIRHRTALARAERAYRHVNRLCRRRHSRRAGATLAMCLPTALLAYYVSRLLQRPSQSRWPAIIQAALVPLSIGLMAASALILARVDRACLRP